MRPDFSSVGFKNVFYCTLWELFIIGNTEQERNEGGKGSTIPRAPSHWGGRRLTAGGAKKSQLTSTFFNTVHLLPKDLRFKYGGTKLASFPGRQLNSLRPWYWKVYNFTIPAIAVQNFNPEWIFQRLRMPRENRHWRTGREFWVGKHLNWHYEAFQNWSKSRHCWFIFRATNWVSLRTNEWNG